MPGDFTAQTELAALLTQRAALENELIAALAQRDKQRSVALEKDMGAVDARVEEIKTVLGHESEVAATALCTPQLWRLVYTSERAVKAPDQPLNCRSVITDVGAGDVEATATADASVALGLNDMAAAIGRWSVANAKLKVTSGLIATGSSFFGVIEGPREVVEDLFSKVRLDQRHTGVVLVHSAKADTRIFTRGAQLSCVPDGLLGHLFDRVREVSIDARPWAPSDAVDLAVRGGHPLGSAATFHHAAIVWTMMLDVQCGAVHRASRYKEAAAIVEPIVADAGGKVVEKFGECMSAWFPVVGGSTNAARVTAQVNARVPFAVQAVAQGSIVVANQPDVVAFGYGFKLSRAMLTVAERNRRPVLITADAGEHCNRARQPLEPFTIDCVNYYTLGHLGMARLESPPEPELIGRYDPGPEPPVATAAVVDDAAKPKSMTRADTAFVKGAWTSETLTELFRKLDVGGVGWVGKDALKKALKTHPDFPKVVDELGERALDGWLARCNKMGESRVNFNEFAMVCLKVVHAA